MPLYLVQGKTTNAVAMIEAKTIAHARRVVFDKHFRARAASRDDLVEALRDGLSIERAEPEQLPLAEGNENAD